jgi:hypothetical protein
MILYELITNAARHAFERGGGEIRVAVWLDGAFVKCSVQGQRIGCASKALGGCLKQTFGPQGSKSLLVFPRDSSPTVIAGETPSGMGSEGREQGRPRGPLCAGRNAARVHAMRSTAVATNLTRPSICKSISIR